MKTKSIIYNSFVPNAEITPAISQDSSPSFKYTGYKPRYKWSDDSETTKTTSASSPKEESDPDPDQITFQDPSSIDWSKIAGYENTPIITQSQGITPATKPRGKHVLKTPDIQVGEMQGLLDAFADAGISLRITSGTRPGARTAQGKQSNHAIGRALDVTPVEGQTFEDLAEAIRNSPDLVAYMREYGYGIYDETTPEALARTGGTGAHWHLGPDKNAILGLETILKGKQGLKIPILFARDGTKTKRYGTRKEQKRNDRVTKMILQETNKKNKNISPITGLRYEEPLQPLEQEIASFLPGVGDVIEAGNIVNNAVSGNIGSALLGASILAIPTGIASKVAKNVPFINKLTTKVDNTFKKSNPSIVQNTDGTLSMPILEKRIVAYPNNLKTARISSNADNSSASINTELENQTSNMADIRNIPNGALAKRLNSGAMERVGYNPDEVKEVNDMMRIETTTNSPTSATLDELEQPLIIFNPKEIASYGWKNQNQINLTLEHEYTHLLDALARNQYNWENISDWYPQYNDAIYKINKMYNDYAIKNNISLDNAEFKKWKQKALDDLSAKIYDYLGEPSEQVARGVQIKNAANITDGSKKFTVDEVKQMWDDYISKINTNEVIDNNMIETYNMINSFNKWPEYTRWFNASVPGLIPVGVGLGVTTKSITNDNKE